MKCEAYTQGRKYGTVSERGPRCTLSGAYLNADRRRVCLMHLKNAPHGLVEGDAAPPWEGGPTKAPKQLGWRRRWTWPWRGGRRSPERTFRGLDRMAQRLMACNLWVYGGPGERSWEKRKPGLKPVASRFKAKYKEG